MEEQEERKGKPPYLLFAILSGITALFFGMSIGAFDQLEHPMKFFQMEKKQETQTTEELFTAVLTYEIEQEEFTEQELKDTISRLEQRVNFWDDQATVKKQGKNQIQVQMQRDYAGETNVLRLTMEENLFLCVKYPGEPSGEELEEGRFFESAGQFYRIIVGSNEFDSMKAYAMEDTETEQRTSHFEIEFTKDGDKELQEVFFQDKEAQVYLMYNEELIGVIAQSDFDGKKATLKCAASIDRANVIIRRIEIGNLPLQLKLISNKQ